MSLNLGADYDNTISSDPEMFKALAQSVKRSAGHVHVITGVPKKSSISPQQHAATVQASLDAINFPYDAIYVAPKPVPATKAAYCKAQGIDFFVDNTKKNVKKVAKVTSAARYRTPKPKK